MCASVNLSQLRLSVRRLEQEIAEPCCREERMAGGAAVNTPNTCRRKERMAGGAAVNTPNTCRRKERMAGGAAVNTPNTCRRKERMAGGAAVNTPNTCRRKERMAGGAAVNTPNTCRRKVSTCFITSCALYIDLAVKLFFLFMSTETCHCSLPFSCQLPTNL
ncbi:uncharacterized protein LOC135115126 [Scylla paramamosain]|uniref:uncharacterized protein LOC135115126 n=1 Tax=Scylla paramamosain TaxID=85552 RepID=UPI00308337C0